MKAYYRINGPDPTWAHRGACTMHEENLWFPVSKSTGRRGGADAAYIEQVKKAKAVCASCPVIQECHDYITQNPQQGIWAGLTEKERKA